MDKVKELDLKMLSDNLGVKIDDLREICSEYIKETDFEIDSAVKMLEENCLDDLQRIMRNIKGVSINLGLHRMHKAADRVESCIKLGKAEELKALLDFFSETYAETRKDIIYAFKSTEVSIDLFGK